MAVKNDETEDKTRNQSETKQEKKGLRQTRHPELKNLQRTFKKCWSKSNFNRSRAVNERAEGWAKWNGKTVISKPRSNFSFYRRALDKINDDADSWSQIEEPNHKSQKERPARIWEDFPFIMALACNLLEILHFVWRPSSRFAFWAV